MATYEELFKMQSDDSFRNRVFVGITVSADIIRSGGDTTEDFSQEAGAHEARAAWVKNARAYRPGDELVKTFVSAMVAANKGLTLAQIQGASDENIQTAVNKVVDILAAGEAV